MTLLQADCSPETARRLTDQLRQSLVVSWDLLVEAYQRRAWAALGYESWDAYTDTELGETRLRLPREQRREVVASMTEAGMSTRAIGAALGVHHDTVSDDRRRVGFPTRQPEPVIDAEIVDDDEAAAEMERAVRTLGTDGKSYPAATPQQPKRKPITEGFWQAAYDLTKATERVARLAEDDRFERNAHDISAKHRSDLTRAIDAIQGVLNRLPAA